MGCSEANSTMNPSSYLSPAESQLAAYLYSIKAAFSNVVWILEGLAVIDYYALRIWR